MRADAADPRAPGGAGRPDGGRFFRRGRARPLRGPGDRGRVGLPRAGSRTMKSYSHGGIGIMGNKTLSTVAIGIAAALLASGPALAQQKVKIGFITTLSGPQGVVGEYMRNSVELALDHLGRKMAGLDVEVIYGDDQVKPDVGKQVADEMLKKHQVDFVAGRDLSQPMAAGAPPVTAPGEVLIGTKRRPPQ